MAVKLGFIGCGSHARTNLYPALRFGDCELVAVADLYEVHRAYCQRHFGARRAYADYRELLDRERELDAVIVCGPAELHYEASIAALSRGLHVMCEKPPARTLAQTVEMREAARRAGGGAGRTLMVAFMKRFGLKYRLAHEISGRAEFGGRRHCHIKYSYRAAMDPRSTGVLMCVHAIDLMRHFMGEPVRITIERTDEKVVDAKGVERPSTTYVLMYRFASGGTGTLIMDSGWPYVSERLELSGQGEAVVVDEVATLHHYRREANAGNWRPPVAEEHRNNFALQTDENNSHSLQGYVGEVVEFLASVKEGRRPAMSTIDDAVEAMRVVEVMAEKGTGVYAWGAGV